MTNFLRALRFAWPYRGRVALSVVCALLAAVFWSLNFTAVYPVLKILDGEQSLQEWADQCVARTRQQLAAGQERLDRLRAEMRALPEGPEREERERELAGSVARGERRLSSARMELYRYQLAQSAITRFLPRDRFLALAWLVGLVVLAVAVKGVFEFGQEALVGSVVNLSLYDLRNRFFRNAIHLDAGHFSDEGTHELISRFTYDMDHLGAGLKTLFGKVVAEPLRALGCVAVACWISWQLTVLFLVLVPAVLLIVNHVGRLMKRATRRLLERVSSLFKILQETFQGIRIVQGFAMEPYERRRFRAATRDHYRRAMTVVKVDALTAPVIELLGMAAGAGALLAGAFLVLRHQTHLFGLRMTARPLEPETLLQLYALLAAIADPVRKLSSVYTRLQAGTAAADRIFGYLDRRPRVQSNAAGSRLARHRAAIEFRDVCFSYEPGHPILSDVRLHFRFGETVALVGKNGCGKTTLAGLIPRFFDPEQGAVLIDDTDVRSVHLRSLRRQVALVTQETILFDDTVYHNIAYGNRRAGRAAVEEAARRAYAHELILRLPQGYQTRVGECGALLSGGQKQRLALARAILRDPAILILDEFTSQSDPESEALIHQALKDFCRQRTTIVITHRLNTLEIADRIVVLDQGRVEAVGTHGELLQTCALYQRLHEAHFQRLCA